MVGKYAIIITAPNSLIPLENMRIIPEKIDFFARGRAIVKNILLFEAPRPDAACSRRKGISENPLIADMIRNGILTNAIATPIPNG